MLLKAPFYQRWLQTLSIIHTDSLSVRSRVDLRRVFTRIDLEK